MKTLALKLLTKIATVVAALLLYGVIAILQMPKPARADSGIAPPATRAGDIVLVQRQLGVLSQFAPLGDFALDQGTECIGRTAHRG